MLRVPQLWARRSCARTFASRSVPAPPWSSGRASWDGSSRRGRKAPRARTRHDVSANWTELYPTTGRTTSLQFTYGLQNYQWGPAELLSPSNRLFHEVGVFRDPLYYVRGRISLRLNVSVGKEWSLVALAELGTTASTDFIAGEPFRRQAQAKFEYAAAVRHVVLSGLAAARGREHRAWFGEYGSCR